MYSSHSCQKYFEKALVKAIIIAANGALATERKDGRLLFGTLIKTSCLYMVSGGLLMYKLFSFLVITKDWKEDAVVLRMFLCVR